MMTAGFPVAHASYGLALSTAAPLPIVCASSVVVVAPKKVLVPPGAFCLLFLGAAVKGCSPILFLSSLAHE